MVNTTNALTVAVACLLLAVLGACSSFSFLRANRLAVVSPDGNVAVFDPDRNEHRDITTDAFRARLPSGRGFRYPVWSPDATRLAFLNESGTAIYMAAASGEWVHEMYRSEVEHPRNLVWSPDSEHLAFTTNAQAAHSDYPVRIVHVISAETGDVSALDAGPDLVWRWAGNRVLHVQAEARSAELTIDGEVLEVETVATDTVTARRRGILGGESPADRVPSGRVYDVLSPNGRFAARFSLEQWEPGSTVTLQIVNVRTGIERRRYEIQPTERMTELVQYLAMWPEGGQIWSPDSRYVAVAHDAGDDPGVWRYAATGRLPPERLTAGIEASWSR